MNRHKLELTKLAKAYGAHLDKRGSGHYAIEGNGWYVIASSSPSDRMALKNVQRDLDRVRKGAGHERS